MPKYPSPGVTALDLRAVAFAGTARKRAMTLRLIGGSAATRNSADPVVREYGDFGRPAASAE
jgi:hypothetical protein